MKKDPMLFITIVATGLTAGIFLTWSCSVIPGLGRLSDLQYLSTMQSINRAIQNPVFFSCFFGAAILLPVGVFRSYTGDWTARFIWLLSATGVYLLGVLAVTIFGNVPLNEALDVVQLDSATPENLAQQRARFEGTWNRLNHVRAIAGIAAFVLLLLAVKTEE